MQQLRTMAQRSNGGGMAATVRKRIWRDINDAHHLRAVQVNLKSGGLPEHGP
jgi:hypothetical protein